VLLVPGIGTVDELRRVRDLGVNVVRIAVHCTEADITEQHIKIAKELGMEAIGFLMMSHMNTPQGLLQQAKLLESYGADTVYIADSAGAMTTEDVKVRVNALVQALDVPLGVHAHNNLAMAVSNSIAAYQEGARNLDGTSAGLGAGAGNCPTEILAAVSDKYGITTGVDPLALMDLAEEVVRPLMPRQQVIDRAGLILGYAGVYGSFLLHAERAAERYNVSQAAILLELGRRQVVGGQEDMIIDVALELAAKHAAQEAQS
jgi:4-hydroxy 2-oxovalerate aldolase